jgi:hypothetical protein
MASINASTSGAGGVITTADATGILNIQTAGTNAVTVDASQNVGIGTTSPTNRLQLSSAGNPGLVLEGTNQAANLKKIRVVTQIAAAGDFAIQSMNDNDTVKSTNLYIDASGKVGIGMTPTAVLSIQTVGQNFGGGLNLKVSGGTSNFEFVNGGDNKLYLGYAASGTPASVGNFATNGTYTATSDIRKKKNISYIFNGLEIVNALKPAQGRMLEDDDTSPLRPMFIAQDMVNVIPALVSNLEPAPSDDPLLGVDYASIAPILVKAIQEQQTLIVSQSELITNLTARVTALEAK